MAELPEEHCARIADHPPHIWKHPGCGHSLRCPGFDVRLLRQPVAALTALTREEKP